ncbi:protoporphyrinogen/coproporphyrinogen oxidase [Arcobacter sp.]|uniref:protoporphyrinogen/coproporphyrinogen oxidase n=1 Tax=Arcobacter sp. TaxID=1872629 RepID=UPI003D10E488
MRICIIGSGITGLTIGKLLTKKHHVTIYEKDLDVGGIARTKTVNGITYHTVGGHCLNSKNKRVMDFIFNEILPKENWHHVKRDAKINFHNHFISYPIEFSVKEIAKFDENLAFNITKDFLSSEDKNVDNLADWFKVKFGETLANEYFIPYNRKIWQMEPLKMSHLWIDGKLPLPNKKDFFKALFENNEDNMPHSRFFYPNSNNQNTFIEALANDLNIVKNFKVTSIERLESKWIINDEYEFDLVISTMPLNILPLVLKNTPEKIINEVNKLKYNKVTTVLWKTKPIDFTWSYYPSSEVIFHRHIHIGNFFNPKENYTITECMGEHSYKEIIEEGKKFDYLLEPIDYNVSDYAYVVYDQNYKNTTRIIKKYLSDLGIYSIGRFGEWEYYNMDICIESAMKLAEDLMKRS